MSNRHPAPENSLAIAMVELDRLERERKEIEDHRRELRATVQRQARDIQELDRALRGAWPRVIARQRRRASAEHRRSCEHRRRLDNEMQREHAERMAVLTRENAERRAALARLEREVVAEFNPARAALTWLTPFAAAGLIAAFAFALIHHDPPVPTELTGEPAAPLAAAVEPVDEPSEVEPVIVSDATVPAIHEPVLAPEPAKPIAKHHSHKPHAKPTPVVKPIVKPNPKPIVLGDGEDPLGNL